MTTGTGTTRVRPTGLCGGRRCWLSTLDRVEEAGGLLRTLLGGL